MLSFRFQPKKRFRINILFAKFWQGRLDLPPPLPPLLLPRREFWNLQKSRASLFVLFFSCAKYFFCEISARSIRCAPPSHRFYCHAANNFGEDSLEILLDRAVYFVLGGRAEFRRRFVRDSPPIVLRILFSVTVQNSGEDSLDILFRSCCVFCFRRPCRISVGIVRYSSPFVLCFDLHRWAKMARLLSRNCFTHIWKYVYI